VVAAAAIDTQDDGLLRCPENRNLHGPKKHYRAPNRSAHPGYDAYSAAQEERRPEGRADRDPRCRDEAGRYGRERHAAVDRRLARRDILARGGIEAGKSLLAAALLREEAEVLDAEGKPEAAAGARRKSLRLYIEALIADDYLRTRDYPKDAEAMLAHVEELDGLPATILRRLYRYHEAMGRILAPKTAFSSYGRQVTTAAAGRCVVLQAVGRAVGREAGSRRVVAGRG